MKEQCVYNAKIKRKNMTATLTYTLILAIIFVVKKALDNSDNQNFKTYP